MLLLVALVAAAPAARADTPFELKLPRGFPRPNIPADNPLTHEKVELGRLLFYDVRLSGNQTYACATCHRQERAFTDGLGQALGATGEIHPRGAMSLANVAFASTLAWGDPTLLSLESQARVPMLNEHPVELGLAGREAELFARLRADARYRRMFREAFPGAADPIDLTAITRALASFQRTLLSGDSAYDRYVFGLDDDAISASAKRGERLFFDETHECFHCHAGFNMTTSVDHLGAVAERPFHNTGLYNLPCDQFGLPSLDLIWCSPPPAPERCEQSNSVQPLGCQCDGPGPQRLGCYPPENTGKYEVTGVPEDMGRFKAPTLRNIAVTGPYMHDGSLATLEEVVEHYAAGGRTIGGGPYAGIGADSPAKGSFVRGFALGAADKADLIAFLTSLTDERFLTNPRFADPFAAAPCVADCNLDGTVTIDELLTAVGITLGSTSLAMCVPSDPNGDGEPSVDELVRAIVTALGGCP